ncbi:MAG: HAD-IC family P-type ATPase [Acidimicrobiia bacterium]
MATASAAALALPPDRSATPPTGLTANAVAQRVAQGEINRSDEHTSRSLSEIIRANVFTLFNAILGSMLVIVLALGDFRDALFGVVIVTNALIGIVQEYRAKQKLDSLAVLYAPKARVMRDGTVVEIATESVVLDDWIELRTGDQIAADGIVRSADGLEVDESLLTGESDPIVKQVGDPVLSGSFVVAGSGAMQATRIGADAYARQLAADARRFTKTRSELMDGINLILKFVVWLIVPTGLLLFLRQLSDGSVRDALIGTVAGVVGMVPEGLVLLTSIAFLVAAVTLARRKVLVQELPAVEGLARVDVLCADKTGTLTQGSIRFDQLVALGGTEDETRDALGAMAAREDANATLLAVRASCPAPSGWNRVAAVPFSSARKWSAEQFDGYGTWVLGAPEMVFPDEHASVAIAAARAAANDRAADGHRVVVLARSEVPLEGESLPGGLEPRSLVLLEEQVRPDARDTLEYFAEQGVGIRVISGDNPRTVAAVARRVGLDELDPIDARELPDDQTELAEVLDTHRVFGRVTPQQKRAFVHALQSRDHTVAMTGDGVNDALALKDADIGIAMGSGSAATRSVAQLVLLDDEFARMPGVVAEGRRVLANVERVANLFVTKTVYVFLLSIATGLASLPFPFLPRHLTLVGNFTIGIPAFFLALAPNSKRFEPGFTKRVARFAVPAGLVAGTATFVSYLLARNQGAATNEARTMATLTILIVAMWILTVLARPWAWWKIVLIAAMSGGLVLVWTMPFTRSFFALDLPSWNVASECVLVGVAAAALIEAAWWLDKWRKRTA